MTADSPSQQNSCTLADQICSISTTNTPFTAETTPQTTPPDSTAAPATATDGQLSMAETICIAIACVTLVLHVILILLCAVNIAVLRNIKKVVTSRTIMQVTPGIRSPSTFNLGPIRDRKIATPINTPAPYETITSQTPADYDELVRESPVPPPGFYEAIPGERRLQFQEEQNGAGSQQNLLKQDGKGSSDTRVVSNSSRRAGTRATSGSKKGKKAANEEEAEGITSWVGSDSPSISSRTNSKEDSPEMVSNSRTASNEDLLKD